MDSIDITMHHKEVSLLKRIGRGSYGVGHEAIWRNNNDRAEVSVKISLQDFEIDHLREIRNLTKFKHANIVALNGIYRKESIGLIFEYSGCGSLYDYLHKKVAEVAFIEKLDWMLQCANGMEYLHIRKIVHRELKTQNLILFDDFRILKICDFNTAKQFVTSNTEIDETVCYMAPELCGDNGQFTEKCDVFCFGVIFWEVLSEKKPFDIYRDLHPLAVQKKIINGDRLNINYIRIHHNSDLITPIIEKCWDGDPENRPTMKKLVSFIGMDCKVYIPINFKDIEIRKIVTKSRYGIVCNAFWRSGFFVRRATLKIIPPNKQKEIINLREIYKLRDLNHRNIVTLYGVSKDLDNRICIIYEGEDCGSLYHLLHYTEENFDIWLKIEWIQQCAQGLAYLHSKNILHRNLNLDNLIIFNKYRLLKICNLGKASEITISNPDFNRIVCYVAPEVWGGKKKFSKAADVYSFGIILWELISKDIKNPFDFYRNMAVMLSVKCIIELCCQHNDKVRPTMKKLIQDSWILDKDVLKSKKKKREIFGLTAFHMENFYHLVFKDK